MVLLRHTISTMYEGIIIKSCKTQYITMKCHSRTYKESVLSVETHIINISKCNMSIYIVIGDHIIKVKI